MSNISHKKRDILTTKWHQYQLSRFIMKQYTKNPEAALGHVNPMEIYDTRLINQVSQKSSTLIGQQATVQIYDWLTKVKQIYEPSCLLVHGWFSFTLWGIIMKSVGVEHRAPGKPLRVHWDIVYTESGH